MNKKEDRTMAMKLSYKSGSSLNAAISSGKCGCIFWMRSKFAMSFSSTLEPILSGTVKKNTWTYGSSLGNAAHIAAFMSKKGPMERGIHRATCRKDSTASDDLDTTT